MKRKYHVYGEGSVSHHGHACEHGLDLDTHPLIVREDYDSRWQYLRTQFVEWCFDRSMKWHARRGTFRRLTKDAPTGARMRTLPKTPWDRLAKLARANPFPTAAAEAALLPEDSIYEREANHFVVLKLHAILDLGEHQLTPAEWNTLDAWVKTLGEGVTPVDEKDVEGSPIAATWRVPRRT